jgi:hypothetical protein
MHDDLTLRIDDLDETVCELISHVETLERVISAMHQKLFCRCLLASLDVKPSATAMMNKNKG